MSFGLWGGGLLAALLLVQAPAEIRPGVPLQDRALPVSNGGCWRLADLLDQLVRSVNQWREGKNAYELACARCHGPDGNSNNYPHIKKLGGLGGRMPQEQIRARINPVPLGSDQYTVRSHVFREKELEALLAYVSGL
jgi:cytochrome c553